MLFKKKTLSPAEKAAKTRTKNKRKALFKKDAAKVVSVAKSAFEAGKKALETSDDKKKGGFFSVDSSSSMFKGEYGSEPRKKKKKEWKIGL